jgi:glycosyltransferase involved in cell wall biosynthesis
LLPGRRFAWIDRLNRKIYWLFFQWRLLIKHRQAQHFYWWLFFPELAEVCANKLERWQVIFDIVDYHDSPDEKIRRSLENSKRVLLRQADHVFSISHALRDLYQPLCSSEIEVVPQGFDLHSFDHARLKPLNLPTGKPIIGFIGQLNERLDFVLLEELCKANSQWNFVFIGPIRHEPNVAQVLDEEKITALMSRDNVFHFPSQERATLLDLLRQFAVCLIPYDVSYNFNRYCYPMKLFEYFYVGRPVVSTPIEELRRFTDLMEIADSAAGFKVAIEKILNKKWPPRLVEQQQRLARDNSWERKFDEITKHLCKK